MQLSTLIFHFAACRRMAEPSNPLKKMIGSELNSEKPATVAMCLSPFSTAARHGEAPRNGPRARVRKRDWSIRSRIQRAAGH
jgi:hypothetical protein